MMRSRETRCSSTAAAGEPPHSVAAGEYAASACSAPRGAPPSALAAFTVMYSAPHSLASSAALSRSPSSIRFISHVRPLPGWRSARRPSATCCRQKRGTSARGVARSFSYLPWYCVASSAGVEYTTGFSSSSSYAPLSRASL